MEGRGESRGGRGGERAEGGGEGREQRGEGMGREQRGRGGEGRGGEVRSITIFTILLRVRVAVKAHSASQLVWLARPSHQNAGRLGLGRDSLAAVTISSHLFNQSDAFGRNLC